MPAMVGKINLVSVEGSVTQFGDIFWASPASDAVVFGGPGSFNSEEWVHTHSNQNITLISSDADPIDLSNSDNV